MKITGCSVADEIGIIMHFYILDVVGERRNVNIQPVMDSILEDESLVIPMNQVFYMLNPQAFYFRPKK